MAGIRRDENREFENREICDMTAVSESSLTTAEAVYPTSRRNKARKEMRPSRNVLRRKITNIKPSAEMINALITMIKLASFIPLIIIRRPPF